MFGDTGWLIMIAVFSSYWFNIESEEPKKPAVFRSPNVLDFWVRNDPEYESGRRTPKKKNVRTNGTTKGIVRGGRTETQKTKRENVPANDEKTTTPLTTPEDNDVNVFSIVQTVEAILSEFENVNVTVSTLGRTAGYKDIALFKITERSTGKEAKKYLRSRADNKYVDEEPEKKIIFIVHGLSVMGIWQLECLTKEKKLKILLEYYLSQLHRFDIFLIPIANPDGYAYSHLNQLYNKNMSPQSDCNGVALDRNFDVAWNHSYGLSSCSMAYPGPEPFSEAETRAIRDVFHYYGHKIIAYINVHAGTYDTQTFKGDAVLYPRGFSESQSDDDKYIDIRGEIEEAMKNASFRVVSVTVDTLHNWYGKVSGSSVDYAAVIYGIPYAMEFVMQLYGNNHMAYYDHEMVDYSALTQIWRRVIHAVYNSIWNSYNPNDRQDEERK